MLTTRTLEEPINDNTKKILEELFIKNTLTLDGITNSLYNILTAMKKSYVYVHYGTNISFIDEMNIYSTIPKIVQEYENEISELNKLSQLVTDILSFYRIKNIKYEEGKENDVVDQIGQYLGTIKKCINSYTDYIHSLTIARLKIMKCYETNTKNECNYRSLYTSNANTYLSSMRNDYIVIINVITEFIIFINVNNVTINKSFEKINGKFYT